ncbi:MAG: malto-oligosyltrehalose synthase [Thermoleophilia bacterium]|jgi:(1->4)-alpha-D-glucan 1-alpha-D-glucosylmutase
MSLGRTPSATYRLQFRAGLDFDGARELVPYLHDLGISHIYASPLFFARRGSSHGYDVTNPNWLDPVLGSAADFDRLVSTLRDHGMGLILDIVPNHMAADSTNPMWMDVLENGRRSCYAKVFDIDWVVPRVGEDFFLVPMLAGSMSECLANGTLRITLEDREDGAGETRALFVRHYDQRFPIRPCAWSLLFGVEAGCSSSDLEQSLAAFAAADMATKTDLLRKILRAGPYRLVSGRLAAKHYAYRRFFDINHLIGVKVEDEEVFEETHRLIFELAEAGMIDGIRIDHIDGLRDPKTYLERLRARIPSDMYVVVEKILGCNEMLPSGWPVAGTTGYDFLKAVGDVFVDADGFRELMRVHGHLAGGVQRFDDLAFAGKQIVLERLFAGELSRLSRRLFRLVADADSQCRLSREDLEQALAAITCALPVYRTYIKDAGPDETDLATIRSAVTWVEQRGPKEIAIPLRYVAGLLSLNPSCPVVASRPEAALEFVLDWQQFTGPVAAKGVEDTALYRGTRLIALDEVGGDAGVSGRSVERLHLRNLEVSIRFPESLNATSTHDTKRSEDVRSRLVVLTECPEEWSTRLRRWMCWNAAARTMVDGRPAPDAQEEILIYQSLLGALPLDESDLQEFTARMVKFTVKALREAKLHSNWMLPNKLYEDAVSRFVETTMLGSDRRFVNDLTAFAQEVAWFGCLNSLAQLLLKIVSPGISDFYQGCEFWALSLTDPDNRRPVDFTLGRKMLTRLHSPTADYPLDVSGLLEQWRDGRIKQFVSARALAFRRSHADLFRFGEYVPLTCRGPLSEHVVAAARCLEDQWAVAIVPRLVVGLIDPPDVGISGHDIWEGTRIVLPDAASESWNDELTGHRVRTFEDVDGGGRGLQLEQALALLPMALLHGHPGGVRGFPGNDL